MSYYKELFERVDTNDFCRLFRADCKCGAKDLYSVKESTSGLKTHGYFICPECGRKFKKLAADFGSNPSLYVLEQYLVCCFRGKKGIYHGIYKEKGTIAVIMKDKVVDYPENKLTLISRQEGMRELHQPKKAKKGGKR